jgi:hypothetical protein
MILKISSIAYGCVIDHDPKEIYPNWMRYKNKISLPMKSKGNIYGSKIELTDFAIKGYDKTYEVKKHNGENIKENQCRLEVEINYMRHLYNRKEKINIRTPEDLFNPYNVQLLAKDLYDKIKTIEKMEHIKLEGLSSEDLKILGVMQNAKLRDQYKNITHAKTYGRQLRNYKSILKNNQDNSKVVEAKIYNKLLELVNG